MALTNLGYQDKLFVMPFDHRGSFQAKMFGIKGRQPTDDELLEHYAGAFPVWLAPVQAVVLPITNRQLEYARQVTEQLRAAGLRAHLDDRNEKVNLKIREAQLQKVPYMLVVGDREAESGTVSVRNRKHGDQGVKTLDAFLAEVKNLIDTKAPAE